MSTVRLGRIGLEYNNEHCKTISGIFLLQHECKINGYALFTVLSCTDMLFYEHAIIEFLVKEGNSA